MSTVSPGSDCSLTISGEKKQVIGEYITKLGPELRKRHGPRKHYTPQQVRDTALANGLQMDYACFAYCLYCSPADFAAIHESAGETCDFVAMHTAIGETFFHGATEFTGGGLVEVVWSIAGGVTDGVGNAASLVGDVAGSVGDVAGGVVGGVFELLGGVAEGL